MFWIRFRIVNVIARLAHEHYFFRACPEMNVLDAFYVSLPNLEEVGDQADEGLMALQATFAEEPVSLELPGAELPGAHGLGEAAGSMPEPACDAELLRPVDASRPKKRGDVQATVQVPKPKRRPWSRPGPRSAVRLQKLAGHAGGSSWRLQSQRLRQWRRQHWRCGPS